MAIQFAWKIIKEKRNRAFLLAVSTAIAALLLFTSYFFIHSLNTSLQAIDGRLGADVIVVPAGMGKFAGENVLSSTVSKVYFNEKTVTEKLNSIEDITEYSPQLFLHTISTSCCGTDGNFPVVAFDPEKDFTLKAFMPGIQEMQKDEVVIGINAGGDRFIYHYNDEIIKETVKLFLEPFYIKNVLFPTGTSADETIFMHINKARDLIKNIKVLNDIKPTDVSAIFINTTPHNELFVKQQIEKMVDGVDVVLGSGLRTQLQKQLLPLKVLSYVMIAIALLLTLLQVATLFSALIRERQKEIGMLFALGVLKQQVYKLLLAEAAIVSFIGSFVGVIISLSVLNDRQTLLYMIFQLPLVFPDWKTTIIISLLTICTVTFCTIVAALLPVHSFFSREPYEVVREGDS